MAEENYYDLLSLYEKLCEKSQNDICHLVKNWKYDAVNLIDLTANKSDDIKNYTIFHKPFDTGNKKLVTNYQQIFRSTRLTYITSTNIFIYYVVKGANLLYKTEYKP